jgi:peroxiredoxin
MRRGTPALLEVGLLTLGLLAFSCGRNEPPPAKRGEATGAGVELPAAESRRPAPGFSLEDIEGHKVQLSDFRGKVVMVNFWATWCPPCRAEIPDFVALQRAYGSKGLQIVGISLDEEGAAKVAPFAAQNRINYAMLVDGNAAAQAYGGIEGIPTTFLIDKQGRVVEQKVGVADPKHWEQAIEALLGE